MVDETGTEGRLRRERERKARAEVQQDQREREWQDRIDYWALATGGFRFGEPDRMQGELYWLSGDWFVTESRQKLAYPLTDLDIDYIRGQDWRISGESRPLTRDEVVLMIRTHAKSLDDLKIAEGDDRVSLSFMADL